MCILCNEFDKLSPETFSIVLCTGNCFLSVRTSSSCDGLGLPGINLWLHSVVESASLVVLSLKCHEHTCCMACKHLSWQCSSGCGKASPSSGLLWQWGPPLGACRRRRKSMRARRARSGHFFRRSWSAGFPCFQLLQKEGALFDVRVKVVLLVVHPSCSHCRPKLSAPFWEVMSDVFREPYKAAHLSSSRSICCRTCRCRPECRPSCRLLQRQ